VDISQTEATISTQMKNWIWVNH